MTKALRITRLERIMTELNAENMSKAAVAPTHLATLATAEEEPTAGQDEDDGHDARAPRPAQRAHWNIARHGRHVISIVNDPPAPFPELCLRVRSKWPYFQYFSRAFRCR